MERFFNQVREELGLRHELTLRATQALCSWLERHVSSPGFPLFPDARNQAHPPAAYCGLVDRALDAIDAPHRDDVSLAMALRTSGLTLDQVDAFVELFLAHIQAQALEGYARATQRLGEWLDRGLVSPAPAEPLEENRVLPN